MGAYNRVAPRDLFNEANLLKCLGKLALRAEITPRLYLKVHDQVSDGPKGWDIVQDENDGSIYSNALTIRLGDYVVAHRRPLNSREAWPLYVLWHDEPVSVFDKEGELSEDIRKIIQEQSK